MVGAIGHGIGGIVDVYYADWKLKLMQHPRVVQISEEVLSIVMGRCVSRMWGTECGAVRTIACVHKYV